jgi:hypothetical protein
MQDLLFLLVIVDYSRSNDDNLRQKRESTTEKLNGLLIYTSVCEQCATKY